MEVAVNCNFYEYFLDSVNIVQKISFRNINQNYISKRTCSSTKIDNKINSVAQSGCDMLKLVIYCEKTTKIPDSWLLKLNFVVEFCT